MKKNNFKSLMQAAVLICTPLVIASCDDVFGDADNPIPSYMSIKEADVNLELHADRPDAATYTRTAIAATGAEIVYSSSDEKVATVDAKTGKITAVGEGECQIIAEATGKDSHGNMTYQPQKSSFTVKVKDYRARISLKEDATKATFNSALIDAEPIDLAEVLDVFPKTGLTIEYGKIDEKTKEFKAFTDAEIKADKVISAITSGKVTLETDYDFTTKHSFTTKVVAHISAAPKDFETKSFKDQQTTAEFTIEVREGIAYISGYDADGKAIKKSMFYLDNDEKTTKPNYTKLSGVVNGTADVYLEGGWYYLDKDIDKFSKSIRVKGDVNIILADGKHLDLDKATNNNSILDETAKKTYTLNIFTEPGMTGKTWNIPAIQDFKEVNIYGGELYDYTTIKSVETVNIFNGDKVTANLDNVGTATIANGDFNSLLSITTLNFKKGTVNTTFSKIGTANISDGTFSNGMNEVTALNFKKGTVNGDLKKMGTVTIADGTITAPAAITASALNITGGTVKVTDGILTAKITMNGEKAKLTAIQTANDKYAVIGDVEVVKGDFTAQSPYHAIDGKLVGTFFSSTTGAAKSWKQVEGDSTTDPYVKTVNPDAEK